MSNWNTSKVEIMTQTFAGAVTANPNAIGTRRPV